MPLSSSPSSNPSGRPASGSLSRARRLALIPAGVCLAEAAALGVLGVAALVSPRSGAGSALAETVLFVVMAAGLVAVAIGLIRGRRWARGPLVATQLVVLLVAASWAGLSSPVGWLIGIPAAAALLVGLIASPGAEADDPDDNAAGRSA